MSESSSRGYSVVVENRDVVVRFNKEIVDWEALSRFLDYLELESIRNQSKLTKVEAVELAEEIDSDVWKGIKHKYIEE